MNLAVGKVPSALLAEWLDSFRARGVRVGPAVGEDAAAIDVGEATIITVTSDPITFAGRRIGDYAVTINANDIATTGGTARWFFATVLMPAGFSSVAARRLLRELSVACERHGVELCGGHTEITDAVTRPVVSGTMIGTVEPDELLEKSDMRPGQAILVTKAAAVEGASILAVSCRRRLTAAGVSPGLIETAARRIEQIGITRDAAVARNAGAVVALHDVTEGGIAGALTELGGFARIAVDIEAIPVLAECREMCRILGIDPLGLIGSGSLLVVCEKESVSAIVDSLAREGIDATRIGEVIAGEPGLVWRREGEVVDGPTFSVDEIARVRFDDP